MSSNTNAGSAVAPRRDRADRTSLIWKDRRLGIVGAVGIAALTGVLVSVTLPRGPTTQTQGLLVLMGGSTVSVLAGLAMLLAPLMHIVARELARLQARSA